MIVLLTLLKIAVVVAVALGLGWLFRWLAVAVTRGGTRKALRTAPVTASFVLWARDAAGPPVRADMDDGAVDVRDVVK